MLVLALVVVLVIDGKYYCRDSYCSSCVSSGSGFDSSLELVVLLFMIIVVVVLIIV